MTYVKDRKTPVLRSLAIAAAVTSMTALAAVAHAAPADQGDANTPPGEFKPDVYKKNDDRKTIEKDVAQLFNDVSILTPKGSLIFEPSIDMSYSSSNRVAIEGYTIIPAITIGLVDVRKVRSTTLTGAATFRYGLTNRLEIEARVPYVYRNEQVRERPLLTGSSTDVISSSSGDGIGDIEAALHYQFNFPHDGGAYFIGNLRAKSRTGTDIFSVDRELITQNDVVVGERLEKQPTGSGFWSIEPSLTAIYPTDPAVFFGNVSYTWNMARKVNDRVGRVDPGDFVGLNFGMGFGINPRTSFSLGYDQTIVFKTTQHGVDDNSDFDTILVGRLMLGFAQQVSDNKSFNLSLAIGVTADAPDVQLTLTAPIQLF